MRTALWAALVLLVGCSPYGPEIEKGVSTFSDGVNLMSAAFDDSAKGAQADYALRQQVVFTNERPRVRLSASCGVPPSALPPNAPSCALVSLNPDQINVRNTSEAERVTRDVARTRPVLKALRGYANALQAITRASDRADFDAASSSLTKSIGDLSTALNLAVPGAGAIIPAAVKAGTFLAGELLDAERRATLSAQTHAVQPHIQTIAMVLGEGLEAISVVRQGLLNETARQLVTPMNRSMPPAIYEARLIQAQERVAELNGLREATPTETARKMAEAHGKLVTALDDPKRNLADLLNAVNSFAGEAQELRSALSTSGKK